jgi:large repetitive protein
LTFQNCIVATGNISVKAGNGCVPDSPERLLGVNVTSTALGTPGLITGIQNPLYGSSNLTYSIAPVNGASTYTWSYSGSGVNILSGQGSTTISVDYDCSATVGNIIVTASNLCVATSPARTLAISPINTMASLGAINGNANPVYGQNGQVYNVIPILGADTYTWS